LLTAQDKIFFMPMSSSFTGLVSLTVVAWDGTPSSFTDGKTVALTGKGSTGTGGTTPFSPATAKAELIANLYFNHAPTQAVRADGGPDRRADAELGGLGRHAGHGRPAGLQRAGQRQRRRDGV